MAVNLDRFAQSLPDPANGRRAGAGAEGIKKPLQERQNRKTTIFSVAREGKRCNG